ncbi:uncharacterized protein LOC130903563 [Diorhabda carinulata]|uniref:uncharacterized protein LOC130903563 n=1 Tax=Diorhabda carinulata TaxID=1163345 RepID=UPI0025A1CF86|nr:uncharacterized protein LOC130903563 [Diorhabda carinulata]
MNLTVLTIFCLTFATFVSVSSQAYIGAAPVCYGNSCPVETTRCKKHIESSDQGYLRITIDCLDIVGASLKEYYFQEPSSLNPYTKYESTSYSDITTNSNLPLWKGNEFENLRRNGYFY